jgi:hypothetical protein
MLFMDKLELSSLIDPFVWISETIGVVRFSVRFSLFRCISKCGYYKDKMYVYKYTVIRERTIFLKVNKEII